MALIVTTALVVVSWGLTGALAAGWARRPLLARLSASFGRPVNVGHFEFSLLGGPQLEAHSVTVAEDPRFGQEYFLRADQLTARLRWTALLHGKIEFGSLSLNKPSLNLVRAADGSWNVESWLPPAKSQESQSSKTDRGADHATTQALPKFSHVAVDGGRINFKRGTEKLQFALADVTGTIDQDSAGKWRVDAEARPIRASVALQEVGTIRVRGSVAGTSARLRPASLVFTWEDASIADALRLARGDDYGVRGALAAELTASIEDSGSGNAPSDEWKIGGAVRMSGLHRWDLVSRDADPAINVEINATWKNGDPRLTVDSCVLEMAHSRMDVEGQIAWAKGFDSSAQLVSSQIGLDDLLAWRRAFSAGTAEGIRVDGTIAATGTLTGWPPRAENADVSSSAVTVQMPGLPGPVRIGPGEAILNRGSFTLTPVMVSLPNPVTRSGGRNAAQVATPPAGVIRVEGALRSILGGSDWPYQIAVAGQTSRSEDLMALAGAFGWTPRGRWTVQGPARVNLTWVGSLHDSLHTGWPSVSGSVDLLGLRLTSVLWNQPVTVSAAHVDLRPGERHVQLASAQAFGARWSGTFDWLAADGRWNFDLSADRLNGVELDRWLGPRARPSLLERLLPFTSSAASVQTVEPREETIAALQARGHLRVGEVNLEPLQMEKLDANAEISGRNITLRRAQANFYGGRVAAEFEAKLTAQPSYNFQGEIDHVNLSELTGSTDALADRLSGVTSGRLTLTARGIGKPALVASLGGQGVLEIHDATLRGFDAAFPPQMTTAVSLQEPQEARFSVGTASFHVQGSRIRVDRLVLINRDEQVEIAGSVGFGRDLDLRASPAPRGNEPAGFPDPLSGDAVWAIGGTLDAPLVRPPRPAASERAAIPTARH